MATYGENPMAAVRPTLHATSRLPRIFELLLEAKLRC